MAASFMFEGLEADDVATVVNAMHSELVAAGEYVIRQGDEGEKFYVVSAGTLVVILDGHETSQLEAGSHFGELALMFNTPRYETCCTSVHMKHGKHPLASDRVPWVVLVLILRASTCLRNADVKATSDCRLWALDRTTFRQVIASTAVRVIQSKVSFLQRSVIFPSGHDMSLSLTSPVSCLLSPVSCLMSPVCVLRALAFPSPSLHFFCRYPIPFRIVWRS
jgi:CRP-like cAMP-binding protein